MMTMEKINNILKSKNTSIHIPIKMRKQNIKLVKRFCHREHPELYLSFDDDRLELILKKRKEENIVYIR
ncbi:MAG: hypothetical protein ACYCS1_04300 [Gammaproteobacteria bacterium]